MAIRRVALIFDNTVRPETSGLYCRRALGNLLDVEHFLPEEAARIPRNAFDLFLNVDDGLRYRLPAHLHPSAYWAIDTHMDLAWSLEKARDFDFVFAAQRDGAEALRQAGIQTARWLPLACDPEIHSRQECPKSFDVCFVGNLFPGPRAQLIHLIQRRFPNTFVGRAYLYAIAQAYSASRTVFNRSVKNDVNMRVFEALACGSLLVTNDLMENGQADFFQDGVHLATYADADELIDKLAFYLDHEEVRERMAAAGRIAALSRHTYLHRMLDLLRSVERGLSRSSSCIPMRGQVQSSSVPKSLDHAKMSACLISWKRPENMVRIVERLRAEPSIDDILVWNNNPDITLQIDLDNVRVINSDRNLVTYGRFLCARQAKHDVVYTQDDDCFVDNIAELHESFVLDPTRIAHGLKLGHLASNSDNTFDQAQMSLLGWGAVFNKEWCNVLDEYISVYGEDEVLLRKADRIFSLLLNRRHRPQLASVSDLPGAEGPESLSVRSDHFDLTRQAVSRVLSILRDRDSQNAKRPSPDSDGVSSREKPDTLPPLPVSSKDRSYFEFVRPELLAMIPIDAARVLDIGCGAGRLAEELKRRQTVEVWGIECDEDAAQLASGRLDHVIVGDIECLSPQFADATFDCIVCGDVLEHLRDPSALLRRIRRWLAPEGCLIASIPNVRHHSVVTALLNGNWTYETAGLLDQDHLRFFTRRETEKLFFRAGFEVCELRPVPGPGYDEWVSRERPGNVKVGTLHIDGMTPEDAEEFYVYQYLVCARPTGSSSTLSDPDDYGLTSIVIVTHNELAYTQQCLRSIRQFTDELYELILVDNGSTDGTREYLRSLGGVKVIANDDNRGFPGAANQGIRAARGEQILLLNNDTLVTTGWLRRLLEALHSDPTLGLAGPCSNNVSGPQQIPIGYHDLTGLDGFAWDWSKKNLGRRVETDRLVGFCLLIRRELVQRIGLLDERFGIGCFEDDDYCRRAIQAGYRAVIASDSFVHHFGSRTFVASSVDFAGVLEENRKRYEAKWAPSRELLPKLASPSTHADRPRRTAKKTPAFEIAASSDDGLILVRKDIRLSLCMIARDNQNTIEPCLKSIRPWVDEMIVVDTGSKDRTADLARELGARVYHFPWCDDFSAARNESLKYARGQWIFWMDTDDTISDDCGCKLRERALADHAPAALGYVIQVHCPHPDDEGRDDMTAVDHVKLFRNMRSLKFEGRIHEQIIPSIRRAGGEVAFTDIHVVHSGADHTEEGRQQKLERDFRLLHLELEEKPDHPFVLFNLGMTHADCEQYDEAIKYLRHSIEVSDADESQLRKAYALLVNALCQTDAYEQARDTCQSGLRLFPNDKELLFRWGILMHHFGRFREAEQAYLRVLHDREERHFTSIDDAVVGFKGRHNLAIVYEDMGTLDRAEDQWRLITRERPRYKPGWRGLGETLLQRGDEKALESMVAKLQGQPQLPALRSVFAARLLERHGDIAAARHTLEQASRQSPEDVDVLRELCRLLFEHGDPIEAERALMELTNKQPQDAAATCNLGTVYSRMGQHERAVGRYQHSVELRPQSPQTWFLLGHALQACGRTDEARQAWQRVLELSPDHAGALDALGSLCEFADSPPQNETSSGVPDTDCPGSNHAGHPQHE